MEDLTSFPETEVFMDRSKSVVFCFVFLTQDVLLKVLLILGTPYLRPCAGPNRGHPCLGLAAIFAGMLYNVQIIQKSSTRNIMHVGIIVLELPASYSGSLINEMD